jgi:hypothetical protein
MARGWESKSVADQQESALEELSKNRPVSGTKEMAARIKLESLTMSRARVLAQLETAANPAYRKTLQAALQSLTKEIEELEQAARK